MWLYLVSALLLGSHDILYYAFIVAAYVYLVEDLALLLLVDDLDETTILARLPRRVTASSPRRR